MATEKIVSFFTNYVTAFKNYDLSKVAACYHLPCTLNTPDKVVLLAATKQCEQVFSDIFTQLQQANTSDIIAKKASYSMITKALMLVCIDWDFIDGQGEVFTDFCAIYHLILIEGELKIINVVSHDISSTIELAHTFNLSS